MKKSVILFFLLATMSCSKINLYGDTFYTVQGKITDSVGTGLPLFPLQLLNTKVVSTLAQYGTSYQQLITATTKTDQNGNFKMTFPRSNGTYNLLLGDGFAIMDSVRNNAYEDNIAQIRDASFVQYFLDMGTIKVMKK